MIEGVDVSHHQGEVDWTALPDQGIVFAIAKATEGGDFTDPRFAQNWQGIADSGIPFRGAYHFFRMTSSPAAQAKNFIDRLDEGGVQPGDLLALDIERQDGKTGAEIHAAAAKWVEAVHAHFPDNRLVVYSGHFWRDVIRSDDDLGCELWLPAYVTADQGWVPAKYVPAAWAEALIWQYSSKGSLSGISGNVDLNHCRLTEEELGRWLRFDLDQPAPATPAVPAAPATPFALQLSLEISVDMVKPPSPEVCWAAGAAAMIGWRNQTSQTIEAAMDGLGGEWPGRFEAGERLTPEQFGELAAAAGLVQEGPLGGSVEELFGLLWSHGPLLLVDAPALDAGTLEEVRILSGLEGDGTNEGTTVALDGSGETDLELESVSEFGQRVGSARASGLDVLVYRASPAPVPSPAGGGTSTPGEGGLGGGSDIDAFFEQRTGQGFIDWFNATQAKKGAWKDRRMSSDSETRSRFLAFWDNIPLIFERDSISIEQFVALQSIVINELGGGMKPVAEKMGRRGHPGLAYLFDRIEGVKRSYNGDPNRTALECFGDDDFLDAHQGLDLHDELAHAGDRVWAGSVYPQDDYPTAMDKAGIIAEADFCKFRGRGMIQTTFRSAYERIVDFVQGYDGAQATVASYREKWSGLDTGVAASRSSNDEWDELFQDSDYVIPSVAIRLHSHGAGGYLAISDDPAVRDGKGKGSFYNMGHRISGSERYGTLFSQRCRQILEALGS